MRQFGKVCRMFSRHPVTSCWVRKYGKPTKQLNRPVCECKLIETSDLRLFSCHGRTIAGAGHRRVIALILHTSSRRLCSSVVRLPGRSGLASVGLSRPIAAPERRVRRLMRSELLPQTLRGPRSRDQPNAQARALLLRVRAAPRARQNRHNRQISLVLHMSFRAPDCETAPALPIWRARRRARQPDSVNVRSGRRPRCNRVQSEGIMAKWRFRPLEKAPFSVVLRHFFDDFLRVFPRAYPWRRMQLVRELRPNCKVMASAAVFLRWER